MTAMDAGSGGRAAEGDDAGRARLAAQLAQLRALYEMTTAVASRCFESCVSRINPRLEDAERGCLANCTVNMLKMKVLFSRRLSASITATRPDDASPSPWADGNDPGDAFSLS